MSQFAKSLTLPRPVFAALAAAVLLAGCASSGEKQASTPTPTESTPSSGISTSGTGNESTGNGQQMPSSTPDLSQHSVYFDFDKSTVKPEYQSVITNWAKYLTANPTAKVQIQGNTDERGSREYNVGLGERRANAVMQALEADGASAQQMSTISYGEERPVCTQHDESCWQQNRRADIVQQ